VKAIVKADTARALAVFAQPAEDGEQGLQQIMLRSTPPSGEAASVCSALVLFPGRDEIVLEGGEELPIPAAALVQAAGLTDKKHPDLTVTENGADRLEITSYSAKMKQEATQGVKRETGTFPDVSSVVGCFNRQSYSWVHMRLARLKELHEVGKHAGFDCVYLGLPVEPDSTTGLLPSLPGQDTTLSPVLVAFNHEGTKMRAEGFVMPASGLVPSITRVGRYLQEEIPWTAQHGTPAPLATQADCDQAVDQLQREIATLQSQISSLTASGADPADETTQVLADAIREYPELLDLLLQAIPELEDEKARASSSGSSEGASKP
jgi:hypothetical protein